MSDPMNWFSLYRIYPTPGYHKKRGYSPPPLIKSKIAKTILITLALGAGGALITMNPAGAVYFMIHGLLALGVREKDYKREIKRLEKKGYVALTKTPEGIVVKLLKKARGRLETIAFEDLKLPRAEKWDGKWCLFLFDIPEKYSLARDLLRRKLKDLGMYNIQRSVFVYPYDCRKELNFIAEHYGIARYATYAELSYSDIDKELRAYFKKYFKKTSSSFKNKKHQ